VSYSPRILTGGTADYDGIRSAAGLDSDALSDTTILSAAFLPGVEARVIKNFPGYASLGTDDNLLLRSAVTKITAAVSIATLLKSETSLEYKYTRDQENQIKALLDSASVELALITVDDSDIIAPGMFGLAGPTRTRKAENEWIYETVFLGGFGY